MIAGKNPELSDVITIPAIVEVFHDRGKKPGIV
jgi:hypothetical protein